MYFLEVWRVTEDIYPKFKKKQGDLDDAREVIAA